MAARLPMIQRGFASLSNLARNNPQAARNLLPQLRGTINKAQGQVLRKGAARPAAPGNVLTPGNILNAVGELTGLSYYGPRALDAAIGNIESLEGVVRGGFGRDSIRAAEKRARTPGYQPYGSLRNYGPDYKRQELQAGGSLRNYGTDYKEEELKAGRQAEKSRPGAGFPGQQRPLTGGPQVPGAGAGNLAAVAPTVYDMTQEGQFQRYMQGSEMNRYFGGPASAQAPKDAAAMQETAMLQQAPTNMPLADYYRSQSAAGRANMDNIIGLMGYEGDMAKWARANPMLAQRAYAQQFQGGVPTQGAPGAVPAVDAALNPAGPEFRGVGGNGERIYNFAADDVTPEKIKAFQELLKKQAVQ